MFSRKLELFTQTFASNATWIAPPGVNVLATLSGRGAPGNASNVISIGYTIVSVSYQPSGTSGVGGSFDWTSPYSYAQSVASDMNADGAASWVQYFIDVWPDQSNRTTSQNPLSDSGNNRDWYATGPSSGPATSNGSVSIHGTYNVPATTGAAATAFGKTFAGGTGGAAPTNSYTDVAITSGNSYPIVVPAGGQVTISYFA